MQVRASVDEAEFYGFMPWALIQRLTLPMTIFFRFDTLILTDYNLSDVNCVCLYRFHSAVVTMELWKEAYAIEGTDTSDVLRH